MSLDRTDSDGNNSDTASLAPGESHQAPVSRDSDEYSDTARNRPQSAVSSNREEELRGTSVSTSTNPSDSASAGPASMPSTHENNRHSNTPSSDNENADAQEEVDNPEKFIQTAHQQRPRRHPFLGQRQAPFTGLGETYDYTEIFEEDEPYTEMGPSARVWKVYNQEVIRIDSDRIEDWRDGLDSLLVFVCKSYLIAFVLC
ncbi:hypothetical protein K435DRAFT_441558 [Dendrothele bispora CBS 962.96]|uniref:DUF6535 domain-containing protein n=1 Tax=Dendrothele bispora (strain CBS 962.96) TaxID=1314807 RepID=A0A4S8L2U9_DENBC|nr:hypothetical protein K435DRAFT_441558 [Dendrothele bispora CBS 962.96]